MTPQSILFFFGLLIFSCQSVDSTNPQTDADTAAQPTEIPSSDSLQKQLDQCGYAYDTLALNLVRINGHPAEMSLQTLREVEQIDSSHSYDFMCPSHFNWTDKSKGESWQTDYFCSNRKYISNGKEVVFDSMNMSGNSFEIPSLNCVFDETTTLDQFAKIFPVAKLSGEIENLKFPADQPDLTTCHVLLQYPYDDAWIFEFHNGKLIRIRLWWLLC